MNIERFTPGPWEVIKKKETDYSGANYDNIHSYPNIGYTFSVRLNENTYIDFNNNVDIVEDKADPFPDECFNNQNDANLIAAAPEMFEALKEVVNKWESLKGIFEHYHLVKATAALNKALGK